MPEPGSDEEIVIMTMSTSEIWEAAVDAEGNPLYPVRASCAGVSLALALPRPAIRPSALAAVLVNLVCRGRCLAVPLLGPFLKDAPAVSARSRVASSQDKIQFEMFTFVIHMLTSNILAPSIRGD